MQIVSIFLSSPGDCKSERNAAHELVERLNADPLIAARAHIEVIAWDWGAGVPLDALRSPQDSVNEHLPVPEVCDVFVGIFRTRFGTPLPTDEFRKEDGSSYLSGSEYEFHRAWQARRLGREYPRILMFRSTDIGDGSEQSQRLTSFFQSPPFHDGTTWTGSVHSFQNTDDFITQLDGYLRRYLSQSAPGAKPPLRNWCWQQSAKLTVSAGPRYTADAHVETTVGKVFDWLLIRRKAIEELDKGLSEVWKHLPSDSVFEEVKKGLTKVAKGFRDDPQWQKLPDFADILRLLNRIESLAWRELDELEKAKQQDTGIDKENHRQWKLRQLGSKSREAAELISYYSPFAVKRVLVVTGPAGQGKTHTLVHEVKRTLEKSALAIGVLGQELSGTGNLWEEIRQCLDYADSIVSLLDALESEAAQSNQRVLIVLDALNETHERGRWRTQLIGMLHEILLRPHLAVALSVRSDYLPYVLPQTADEGETLWVTWEHSGFAGMEPDALIRYFTHFGVKAPIAPPIGELENPLYVQLLAKSMQEKKELIHWLPSWLEVWNAWVDKLESDAMSRTICDPSRINPIRRTLQKLAQTMLETASFVLSRERADEIARRVSGSDGVIGFLCSAGALIDRIDKDHEEVVDFAYERLSDTFLADLLLKELFQGLATHEEKQKTLVAATEPDGTLFPLVAREWTGHPLAYRRAGLLRALCLFAPRHIGCELPTVFSNQIEINCWELSGAFADSLRWRNRPEEFGATPKELWELWKKWCGKSSASTELDELLALSLIPGHPFEMKTLLHPWLLRQDSPGARDACWTIHVIPLSLTETSTLSLILRWATEASLDGLRSDIALPAAQVLAWFATTSQQGMREKAMQGLTRLLAACPETVKDLLPDFLTVNDAYVVEAVLIAVWGMVVDGHSQEAATFAAQRILKDMYSEGNSRWCHVTIRHYARRIVEAVHERGWLPADLEVVKPPYRSTLPLDEVPDKAALKALDDSRGFGMIVFSSTDWDFYRYVMGGNWGTLPFSSTPRESSTERLRSFTVSDRNIASPTNPEIFDLALAGRFVAWNCRNLGWTAERFEQFDTGYLTDAYRMAHRLGRIERIGKKYQWISWNTLLAFLADNYELKVDRYGEPGIYDSPAQLSYIDMYDPSRWIGSVTRPHDDEIKSDFWAVPSLPKWPSPEPAHIKSWGESPTHDLSPVDVITWVPELHHDWGSGTWLRIAAEHIWEENLAPGQWGINREFHADIWWQIYPRIVASADFPCLLTAVTKPKVLKRLRQKGRFDPPCAREVVLPAWCSLENEFAEGFRDTSKSRWDDWFPVPWMHFVGECGDVDRRDEHRPVLMPWPRLFREWQLELDLRRGVVHRKGEIIFGLAGWVLGQDALLACLAPLQQLLKESGYRLIWLLRGERRAFLNITMPHDNPSAWVDLRGLAYLGVDSRVQLAWFEREFRSRD